MTSDYKPISCSFYDRLEEAATLRKEVNLEYYMGEKVERVATKIKTFELINKTEFMILVNGQKVRLDRIISIDGVLLNNDC
jgi:Rho-binding antiterminator